MLICPACDFQTNTDRSGVCPTDGCTLVGAVTSWATDPAALVGHILAERYLIESVLGAGGSGYVFAARHRFLGRRVAIKLLRPERLIDEQSRARFIEEARAMTAVEHPGLVGIIDFGYTRERLYYLVMEHLDGETLRSRLRRIGPLGRAETVGVFQALCSSLEALHAVDLCHRDVKPENVMLVGQPHRVVLLDLGLATTAGQALPAAGTPCYMSPEQIRGEPLAPTADIYAMGCLLVEMISGRAPFTSESVDELLAKHLMSEPQLSDQLAPDIRAVALRCLAKEPNGRPTTTRALLKLLTDGTRPAAVDPIDTMDTLGPEVAESAARVTAAAQHAAVRAVPRDANAATGDRSRSRSWPIAALAVVALLLAAAYLFDPPVVETPARAKAPAPASESAPVSEPVPTSIPTRPDARKVTREVRTMETRTTKKPRRPLENRASVQHVEPKAARVTRTNPRPARATAEPRPAKTESAAVPIY